MKKNLLLYILLGFLVVMNGFFLFKHFSTSNQKGPQRPARGNFIAKQLDFDVAQMQKFEELDRAHHEKMSAILDDIRSSKDALFDRVSYESIDDSDIDSITTQIANKEKAKELEIFKFFKEVGEICTDDQKERFRSILKDAVRGQGPPGRNGPPRGGPEDGRRPPPPRH